MKTQYEKELHKRLSELKVSNAIGDQFGTHYDGLDYIFDWLEDEKKLNVMILTKEFIDQKFELKIESKLKAKEYIRDYVICLREKPKQNPN